MLAFVNKSSSYFWNKIPESVQSFLLNNGITISNHIWIRLPENVQSYIFKKAMSMTPPVALSQDEKNEIDNFLDRFFNEELTTSNPVSLLPHSETTLPSEANQPDEDKNEGLHLSVTNQFS
ncbi:hypothetical protein [Legionella brunensis]|uniref:Uncharacterized protein n=1 Tax=Legionella brunensis TaxID=29422 RepID=A0A0W0S4J7_9GAMM|nr:hypothetical protein [Legionella brunensis]KTC77977.1 hypothetical protein Lbru_2269 [Legionella brunensis]